MLKRSADEGKLSIRDVVRKNQRSLPDLLLDVDDEHMIALLEQSPELGNGTYGQAKELIIADDAEGADKNLVAKITGCASGLLGDVKASPWRAENVEPTMLQFLWTHLAETNVTPHLVAPLGGRHAIIEGTTEKQKKDDDEIANSLVYFMEKATRGTVRSFLRRHCPGVAFDRTVKVILFQLCYTLAAIFMRFPWFRHNDLKDDNVLLHAGPTEGVTEYVIHGTTFRVPNVGVVALMADVDFACIRGYMFENYKTIEQEIITPSYHIDTRKDHAADVACFMAYVRNQFSSKMTGTLRDTLFQIYGAARKDNGYRATYLEAVDMPTVEDLLLETSLFEEFVFPRPEGPGENTLPPRRERSAPPASSGGCTDSYNADHNLLTAPIVWPYIVDAKEKRYCFMFKPRHCNAVDVSHLPSYQYLERCPPVYAYIDDEPPREHNEEACDRLMEALECLYDAPAFTFSREKYDTFYDKVAEIASAFIIDYFVPERWWPAVYTCAFIDAAEEVDVANADQVCWDLYQWARFWEKQGEVRYSEMNMLHFAVQWGWLRQ